MDEGDLIIRLVELFRSQEFQPHFCPNSAWKASGYQITWLMPLSCWNTLTQQGHINLFDGYPKYAACHPGDGTTVNISYDGRVHSCNWMAGKEHLSVGSIFQDAAHAFHKYQEGIHTKAKCVACCLQHPHPLRGRLHH